MDYSSKDIFAKKALAMFLGLAYGIAWLGMVLAGTLAAEKI